jgi:hypothetical protein
LDTVWSVDIFNSARSLEKYSIVFPSRASSSSMSQSPMCMYSVLPSRPDRRYPSRNAVSTMFQEPIPTYPPPSLISHLSSCSSRNQNVQFRETISSSGNKAQIRSSPARLSNIQISQIPNIIRNPNSYRQKRTAHRERSASHHRLARLVRSRHHA